MGNPTFTSAQHVQNGVFIIHGISSLGILSMEVIGGLERRLISTVLLVLLGLHGGILSKTIVSSRLTGSAKIRSFQFLTHQMTATTIEGSATSLFGNLLNLIRRFVIVTPPYNFSGH